MKNKIIAIALALTTVMSVAPFAGAATTDDLQAQINQLSEQVKQILQVLTALTAQGTITTTPAVSASNCFTKTLQKGMTDKEVETLQTVLKTDPSIYPEGLVTGYFGPLTEAAVKKFQAKYGIDQTGIVGPNTRAKLNSLYCTAATPTPTATETTTATVTPTVTVVPSYGTLSVQNNAVSQADSTLEAGKTYELVAGQYKASGSDITIKKVAVRTETTDDVFPWQIFSAISLWDGSTKLAEVAINSANLIEDSFARKYTLNIAGLNVVVPNGQNKVLTVKGTTLGYLTKNAQDKSVTVSLPVDQLVFSDTAGIVYTVASGSAPSRTLNSSKSESNEASVKITLASDNPKEGAVVGNKTSSSKVDLVKFNTKVENVSYIMNKMTAIVEIPNNSGTSTLSSVELYDDSGFIASASVNFVGSAVTTSVEFTNFTLPIAAETTKTFTIKGVIKSLPNNFDTEAYKVSSISVSGVDANNNLPSITNTVSGNYQHVYLVAPQFTLVSASMPVKNDKGDEADATLSFDVKAVGGDIYFSTNEKFFISASASGVSTSSYIMDVTGYSEKTGSYYRVAENTTTRVALSIHLVGNGNYAQFKINSLTWGTSTTNPTAKNTMYGLDDFKTPGIYLSVASTTN